MGMRELFTSAAPPASDSREENAATPSSPTSVVDHLDAPRFPGRTAVVDFRERAQVVVLTERPAACGRPRQRSCRKLVVRLRRKLQSRGFVREEQTAHGQAARVVVGHLQVREDRAHFSGAGFADADAQLISPRRQCHSRIQPDDRAAHALVCVRPQRQD